MKIKQVAAALSAAALLACSGDAAAPEVPEAALLLTAQDVVSLQTAWSGYDAPARVVITSDAEWAEAWDRIYRGGHPVPARPAVDFSQNMIVLAAMGQRPTTGYMVSITETRIHQGVLYVRVTERSPGSTCGTGQAVTAPVHAVQIARQSATPQFIVQRQTYGC